MQEFMYFIRSNGDIMEGRTEQEQQDHIQKVGAYIGELMQSGKLKSAQPLEIEGTLVEGSKGTFKDGPFNEAKEVIVGYFHILAENLEEATEIAKKNPIFESFDVKAEVRPIKQLDGIN